jgi:hypothetical protein
MSTMSIPRHEWPGRIVLTVGLAPPLACVTPIIILMLAG